MPRLASTCLALLAVAGVAVAETVPELRTERSITRPRGGAEWPQWSGPAGNLTSLGNGLLGGAFGLERVWSRPLGSAYSGILVADGRLATAFSDGESDFLVALDASTGAEQWRYRISDAFLGLDASDDGPLATPTLADGTVYGLGARGELFAVSLKDGTERWRLDLVADFGAVMPHFGFATAPTVVGDLLVVETGGDDGRSISAFDRKTGALRWSTGDDPVSYQSPMAFDLGGKTLVVAVTDRSLLGLAPETGEVLWRYQHTEGEEPGFGEAQPVPVGENGILLVGSNESVLFQVVERAEGYAVAEAWRSRALRRTLAVPVPHEGYLYGYVGHFLTCVDAANGETVWKSRPPGSGTLVLIDGHLVILNRAGEIVVAEATPEAYREVMRVEALERGYVTRPSFADATVFVRNLTDIGAIRFTEAKKTASAGTEPADAAQLGEANWNLLGDFGVFVRKLAASETQHEMVERFLAEHPVRPILEGPSRGKTLVHFVYHGEVDDLAVSGNFIPEGGEHAMHRVPGTDLYFRSYELPEKAVFSYRFSIFEERMTDPANPRTTGPEGRERSLLATSGWRPPSHLREPEGPPGRMEKLTWKSERLDNERDVQVYLPPGYDEGRGRYPLLVVYNGGEALSRGEMDKSLDNLIGQTVAPLIAAFVPDANWREFAGSMTTEFAHAHVEELIPLLDETFRTDARRGARAVLGPGSSSLPLYVALHHPETFSRAAVQSYRHGDLETELMAAASGEPHDLELLFHWSSYDRVRERQEAESVVAALKASGYRPTILESHDGVGWAMWQGRMAEILEALFPLE
ncbi:MAG: PQQ-binding-like beta-propeller repeat protein [Acidobacteriota bacterium]